MVSDLGPAASRLENWVLHTDACWLGWGCWLVGGVFLFCFFVFFGGEATEGEFDSKKPLRRDG